jgi:uncharacterized membrane protein
MKLAADARTISLIAIMTALVFVVTKFLIIPVGTGYFNFSDVIIYFAAFAFGPWVALIAGGLGAALADVSSGYAYFAPLTFFAHGLEGFVAGYIVFQMRNTPMRYVIGWLAGAIVMIAIYFIGESAFDVLGGPAQAVLDLPGNILQNIGGGIVGFALYYAVRRAYPQIDRFAATA